MIFDDAFQIILRLEGDESDDARDKGGFTRFGISSKSYPQLNIKNLTLTDAKQIYFSDYWRRQACDELPPGLDLLVFDCAVNQGASRAASFLQEILGLRMDGVIGPVTLAAVRGSDIRQVMIDYNTCRVLHYQSLPDFEYFGRGWVTRVFDVFYLAVDDFLNKKGCSNGFRQNFNRWLFGR